MVEDNSNKIIISSQLSISNSGERGTTLNEIETQFMQDGKKYKLKTEIGDDVVDDDTGEILGQAKVSINPHETISRYVSFSGLVDGTQDKIEC